MPLTKDEIRSLLNDVENERVERTIATDNTRKMSEAICSFANDIRNTKKPGYFIIGALDDGRIEGMRFSDEQLRAYAGLRNSGNILPPPAMMVYKESFDEGDVAILEVQPSNETPVRYKGVIWIRIGASKAEANSEEERILTEKSQSFSLTFDGKPCREATIEDLDIKLFSKEYLPKAVSPKTLERDIRTPIQQMASLRLFDTKFNCPTYAGILLLGHSPQYFIPGAYIQYVKFAGQTRATKVLKEYRFKGNLIAMLGELDSFIKFSIENKRPVFVSALREESRINYPAEALRELLMNAVMHRAYNGNNSPIKFYEYSDRIEIDNPGNLYGKVNLENFPNETDYRNPNIAEIMANLGYVNRFGSGVNTVSALLESNGSGPATFLLGDMTTFKVVVKNADVSADGDDALERPKNVVVDVSNGVDNHSGGTMWNDNWNDAERSENIESRVLKAMRADKRISVKQLSNMFGMSKTSMFRIIEKLKVDGKLKRIGPEKSGLWEVLI
jgi:ATP-dependent DNA helicase RecG